MSPCSACELGVQWDGQGVGGEVGESFRITKRKNEPQTLQITFPKYTFSQPGIWWE